jgi:hypothetical protein
MLMQRQQQQLLLVDVAGPAAASRLAAVAGAQLNERSVTRLKR